MMKHLFLTAAWVNWFGGVAFFFFLEPFFQLLSITPLPTATVYMDIFAVLVFMFGCGYYWASQDFAANRSIIRLGALAKLMLVLVVLVEVSVGNISWQALGLFSIDLVYGILFWRALSQSNQLDSSAYSHN